MVVIKLKETHFTNITHQFIRAEAQSKHLYYIMYQNKSYL